MGDFTVIAAAVAGAVAGALLLLFANSRDSRAAGDPKRPAAEPQAVEPQAVEPPTPTQYATRRAQTAAPILLAVGLALLGVGLALGSVGGALDIRPVLPGVVVLLVALVALLRQGGPATPPDGQSVGAGMNGADLGSEDATATDGHSAAPGESTSRHDP